MRPRKLSVIDVQTIRTAPRGTPQRVLAQRYGVTIAAISKIRGGLLYKDLNAVVPPVATSRRQGASDAQLTTLARRGL